MAERIFGLETEYAFAPLGPRAQRLPTEAALARFMDLARRTLPHLAGKDSGGIFLQNGSRFYMDSGNHPEVATPEVLNPWDACRYVLAGQQILAGLARRLAAEDPTIHRVFISLCNFSYAGNGTTWACHESYGHRMDPAGIPPLLIPHLVSRVIFTGSGGFNNLSPGLEFMVSPRVAHLVRVNSADSQRNRGIYHDKDEPLSRAGNHRLHVLCGESVCSHTSAWLKVGTTALVLAMIEGGLLRDPLRLHSPLSAVGLFGTDVTCAARAPGANGRGLSALEIQRYYLEQAEAHLGHPIMPSWAPQVCRLWRSILDRLAHGPEAVAKTLDWAIKLSLYRDFAKRRQIAWESLPRWSHVLAELSRALRAASGQDRPPPLTPDMLASNSPIAEAVSQLKPYLRTHGLSLEQAPEVLALRSQLFEIDSRFGELDDEALFARLDRAGVLDHRVDGVDNIPHAVENPPAGGRAHLRGLCVRRFQAQRNECRCDWQGVWDFRQRRFLDLSDPFVAEEHWSPIPEERRPPYEDPFPRYLESTLRQAFRCYDQGSYEQAHLMLERIRPVRHLLDLRNQVDFLRLDCWTGARSGRLDGESILQDLPRDRRESVWGMLDYVTIYRFRGLVADPAAAAWIQRGQDLLRQQTAPQPEATMAFREHQGCCLMAEGRLGEARDVLEEACRQPRTSDRFARVACRAAATLGEVYRRLGQPGKAREILEQNRTRQMSCGFHGEMAEFTLPSLAKLATEASAAVPILAEARRIQTESHHLMGLARTLLLESRLAGDAGLAARHRQELVRVRTLVPALRQCPLLGEILSHWEQWTDLPGGVEYHGDRFWGL